MRFHKVDIEATNQVFKQMYKNAYRNIDICKEMLVDKKVNDWNVVSGIHGGDPATMGGAVIDGNSVWAL